MRLSTFFALSSPKSDDVVSQERVLDRYRLIMAFIGVVYPLWRYMIFFVDHNKTETWAERGLIGALFMIATLATYLHPFFEKHVATLFDIVAAIWTLQVFALIWRSELDPDYMQVGLITIFCVGGSFLNRSGMLKYYLLCLILVGYTSYLYPNETSATFFFGVLIAMIVSYVCFMTLLEVFKDLRRSQEALAKRTKEFEDLSAAVQTLFLPNATYVKERGYELAGYYRPATTCGGDWWSFFAVAEESVTILVGDITGHGPGSAMMTASVASYLKAIRNSTAQRSVPDLLHDLNHYLLDLQKTRNAEDRYLMTMAAVEVDLRTQRLRLWSAGAPFPFLLSSNGEVQALGAAGHPLGLSAEMSLGFEDIQIAKGDRVFLYTDGITEMRIKADRQLGERRLTKLIKSTREMNPQDAVLAIEGDLDRQKHGTAQEDDFTFVVLDVA